MSGKSIFDKLWERHVVTGNEGEPQLMDLGTRQRTEPVLPHLCIGQENQRHYGRSAV